MASRPDIDELLEAVARSEIDPKVAAERLATMPYEDLGFARVDTHRELRQGAPEVILGQGKTPAQVVAVARALDEAGASSVLVTRAGDDVRAAMRDAFPDVNVDDLARAAWLERESPDRCGKVVIVSAGTSDGPVVHEARIRAELLGAEVVVFEDVGVAGLHRLAPVIPEIRTADCVVAVAGMDGALGSVIGGLASCPVIGVPTSVGYGSANGGRTALDAMLSSCADGLAVVGIDDGLGAGTVAAKIARASAS
ncbi:MAG TPA: nickel pincer cofactor biosynthesis protein LarB [Actinomycetota bacterium]|nr:nickel pincer cofactor biosynthesis protein LarB [Actinomycetota bacterium]